MPSKSKAEHRFWGAMKSHPAEAAAKGISPATVNEFLQADAGRVADLPDRKTKKKPTPQELARALRQ